MLYVFTARHQRFIPTLYIYSNVTLMMLCAALLLAKTWQVFGDECFFRKGTSLVFVVKISSFVEIVSVITTLPRYIENAHKSLNRLKLDFLMQKIINKKSLSLSLRPILDLETFHLKKNNNSQRRCMLLNRVCFCH